MQRVRRLHATGTIGTLAKVKGFHAVLGFPRAGFATSYRQDALPRPTALWSNAFHNIQWGRHRAVDAGRRSRQRPWPPLIVGGFTLMRRILTSQWNQEPTPRIAALLERPPADSCWARARGSLSWKRWNTQGHAVRRFMLRNRIGYASTCEAYHRVRLEKSAAKSPARIR